MGVPTAGCWEGVVVDGHAPVNEGALASTPARGIGAGGCREVTGDVRVGSWGGCDAADSSGVLRLVRIAGVSVRNPERRHAFHGDPARE
jgi:hypothetical protein